MLNFLKRNNPPPKYNPQISFNTYLKDEFTQLFAF